MDFINFDSDTYSTFKQKFNQFTTGVVVRVFEDSNSYIIQTSDGGLTLEGKPVLTRTGGGLRGSGGVEMLQVGATVVYSMLGSVGYIVGCLPPSGQGNAHTAPITFATVESNKEAPNDSSDVIYRNGNPPDILMGDFVKYTPEGGFISLLRGCIAKIGASHLSNIQFNSIDDHARLTARNFDFYTDLGEMRFHDDEGETNFELSAAPNFFETLGTSGPGEELGTHSESEGKLRYRAEPFDKMGKYRIHGHIGWLGDLIHLFISRRPDADRRTDKSPPEGLAEVFISHDGAIRVRSAREIISEKVSKIPIPKRIREPYHNEKGDTKDDEYAPSTHKPYVWSEEHREGRRMQGPEYHNHSVDNEEKRHFKDHKKDFNVRSERTIPKPPRQADDIYEGQAEAEFEESSSIIHQRSDGSVYIEDSWGSCYEMGHENISISARKDIRIQAGRDLLVTAGRDATFKALENFEVVSHSENIRIKAHKNLLLAAETEKASLESASSDTIITSRKGDILIRSERNDIYLKSHRSIGLIAVTGFLDIRSNGGITVLSDTSTIQLHSHKSLQLTSGEKIIAAATNEAMSPKMTSTPREKGNFTNLTKETDTGFISEVDDLINNSFLVLEKGGVAKLRGAELVSITSDRAISTFTPGAHLNLTEKSFELSTSGSGVFQDKRGVLQEKDSEDHSNFGPGAHSPRGRDDAEVEKLSSVAATMQEEQFALGRFRWRDKAEVHEDIKVYQYPWQHEGSEIAFAKNISPLDGKIPLDDQDTPDMGYYRPVDKTEQLATETDTEDTEVTSPFSQYFRFTDGKYDFKEGVTPGTFEETQEFLIPTQWDDEPEGVGRINKIPSLAESAGESFKGDLLKGTSEDPITERAK